jgi:hypothetical protein
MQAQRRDLQIKNNVSALCGKEDTMNSLIEFFVLAFLLIALAGPFCANLYARLRRPVKKADKQPLTTTES